MKRRTRTIVAVGFCVAALAIVGAVFQRRDVPVEHSSPKVYVIAAADGIKRDGKLDDWSRVPECRVVQGGGAGSPVSWIKMAYTPEGVDLAISYPVVLGANAGGFPSRQIMELFIDVDGDEKSGCAKIQTCDMKLCGGFETKILFTAGSYSATGVSDMIETKDGAMPFACYEVFRRNDSGALEKGNAESDEQESCMKAHRIRMGADGIEASFTAEQLGIDKNKPFRLVVCACEVPVSAERVVLAGDDSVAGGD